MGDSEVTRFERWPMLLDEYVAARTREPFAWGTNDCATFAFDWIEACTGEALLVVEHDDAASAARAIAAEGGLQAGLAARLGEPLEYVLQAQRGDVGLVDIEGRQSIVVVIGDLAVGPGTDGLAAVPFSTMTQAWRV